jgi:GNAT superfamily N-acetyltransferase
MIVEPGETVTYRPLRAGDEGAACDLILSVFDEYVAPEYSEEGVREFYRYVNPDALASRRKSDCFNIIAEREGSMVGFIEVRERKHVSLLFVRERGRGIARELFERALGCCVEENPDLNGITVNSSTYAVPIYKRLGFLETGSKETKNGITYIPMKYTI